MSQLGPREQRARRALVLAINIGTLGLILLWISGEDSPVRPWMAWLVLLASLGMLVGVAVHMARIDRGS